MGKTQALESSLTRHTTRSCICPSHERPASRLQCNDIPLHRAVKELLDEGLSPIYIVGFLRKLRRSSAGYDEHRRFDQIEKSEIKLYSKTHRFSVWENHSRFLSWNRYSSCWAPPEVPLSGGKLAKQGLLKIVTGTGTRRWHQHPTQDCALYSTL